MDASQSVSFHAFVPYTNLHEPGLILVASLGEIRFWDNISIGLTGGNNYVTASLELADGEMTTSLTRSDVSVISLSSGKV
jgi:nuclear pore complex protein Nup133